MQNNSARANLRKALLPSEYDINYFDGRIGPSRHEAGYGKYERWYRFEGENSLGEKWRDMANGWINHLAISGKKLLEVGCAKGFLVKDLRDLGVDAYGLDVSSYAIGECESEVAPYLTIGDATTYLTNYSNNEFDVVFSRWFFEGLDPDDTQDVIDEMGRIGKQNVHIIDPEARADYYTAQPISWWESNYSWPAKTTLVNLREEWIWLSQ